MHDANDVSPSTFGLCFVDTQIRPLLLHLSDDVMKTYGIWLCIGHPHRWYFLAGSGGWLVWHMNFYIVAKGFLLVSLFSAALGSASEWVSLQMVLFRGLPEKSAPGRCPFPVPFGGKRTQPNLRQNQKFPCSFRTDRRAAV